ncbi:transglutaminase [Geomonas limicola]|uniref:Transglutaminase n=1 Tax=Geomonas limicola TaxID=2740186 RepID=A0A6V8N408_9BACT|nr:transglutaminase-like domain-containing protein [Geomonas limicola]GFO67272.1 transglutaminase [Geomonas limicola]
MRTFRAAAWRLLFIVTLVLAPLLVKAAGIPKLAAPPVGERWFTIIVGGERVGFAHLSIAEVPDGYRIDSDGSVKMRIMAVSREATTKESYLVGRDLALRSFSAESRIDGSPLSVRGELTPKGIRVITESGDGKKERTLKAKGPVYPPPVLNFYPLIQGTPTGKTLKLAMLDSESVKVKQVKVEVVGVETLPPQGTLVHLRNDLYPVVDNDIWVDLKGNTVKESVRDDLVLTIAEQETTAKAALAEAALAKGDLALDFSLVKLNPPLERPTQLKKLVLDLTGIPAGFPLLQGSGQQVNRLDGGTVRFLLPNPALQAASAEPPGAADLEPGQRIPSDNPKIAALKNEILSSQKDPAQAVRLLVQWVAREIKPAVTDNQSPVETLTSRAGNCQTHTRLYTALARSAGIPTRFVSGLVYADGKGFLYHAWAESYLNGTWVPVDPTFGEVPANLTHLKLVQGDSNDDLALLAGVIGRVKAKVVELAY